MNVYDSIMAGLNQAVDYTQGNCPQAKTHKIKVKPLESFKPEDIKLIRTNLQMTQVIFAAILGVSKKTVEAWEQGINSPSGPASRLLKMFKDNPANAQMLVKSI